MVPCGWTHGKFAASRSRNRSRFVRVTGDFHAGTTDALVRESGGAERIVDQSAPFGGGFSAFRSHVWYHEQSLNSALIEM